MAFAVKHDFVSGVPDGVDATQIQPSDWNAAHTLSGSLAIAQVNGLQVALNAKVSSASLETALEPYLTSASAALSTYVTSASLATALAPYLTSASAALSTYVTSASLATALSPYLTSASAALSTYVTSASLATALGPYLTSASAALATYLTSLSASTALAVKQGALLFQDEAVNLSTTGAAAIVNFTGTGVSASLTGGLLTVTIPTPAGGGEGSVSISAMIAVAPVLAPNQLTVAGSATFSGTAAFLVRPLIGGRAAGFVLLAEAAVAGNSLRFSGSWTGVAAFCLQAVLKNSGGSGTASVAVYTDGGTTPFLSVNCAGTVSAVAFTYFRIECMAGTAVKSLSIERTSATVGAGNTATANAGVINAMQLNVGASQTLSAGVAMLWGWYR